MKFDEKTALDEKAPGWKPLDFIKEKIEQVKEWGQGTTTSDISGGRTNRVELEETSTIPLDDSGIVREPSSLDKIKNAGAVAVDKAKTVAGNVYDTIVGPSAASDVSDREVVRRDEPTLGEKASDYADRAKVAGAEQWDKAKDAAADVRDKAHDMKLTAQIRASDKADEAKTAVEERAGGPEASSMDKLKAAGAIVMDKAKAAAEMLYTKVAGPSDKTTIAEDEFGRVRTPVSTDEMVTERLDKLTIREPDVAGLDSARDTRLDRDEAWDNTKAAASDTYDSALERTTDNEGRTLGDKASELADRAKVKGAEGWEKTKAVASDTYDTAKVKAAAALDTAKVKAAEVYDTAKVKSSDLATKAGDKMKIAGAPLLDKAQASTDEAFERERLRQLDAAAPSYSDMVKGTGPLDSSFKPSDTVVVQEPITTYTPTTYTPEERTFTPEERSAWGSGALSGNYSSSAFNTTGSGSFGTSSNLGTSSTLDSSSTSTPATYSSATKPADPFNTL